MLSHNDMDLAFTFGHLIYIKACTHRHPLGVFRHFKEAFIRRSLEILVLKAKIQWHYLGGLSNAIQPNLPFRKSVKMRNAA